MGLLRASNLGKAYRRYPNKWGRFAEWLGSPIQHELHWALRGVSFDITAGEAVGVVGANGAGKSTLLKIITGTTHATTGTYETQGRISALLELGIGFHPEFTGRQNVVMAGHLQGIPMEQLQQLMPAVEDFAEIGDYIDQPVRTYSSGMQVRLAFSVATVVRPDILIVDEALSVGDIYFQQKCFDRIREFRDAGTTLLFVTHSLPAVYNLCTRALYIENGQVQLDATPREVIDLYQARIIARTHRQDAALEIVTPASPESVESEAVAVAPEPAAAEPERAVTQLNPDVPPPGSYFVEDVILESVRLLDEAGQPTDVFFGDRVMIVEIAARFDRDLDDPHFGFQIRDRMGQALFMTTTHGLGASLGRVKSGDVRTVRFRFRPLIAPGQYTVTAGVANRGRFDGSFEQSLVRHHDVASFTVVDEPVAPRWAGIVNLQPTVEVARGAR